MALVFFTTDSSGVSISQMLSESPVPAEVALNSNTNSGHF